MSLDPWHGMALIGGILGGCGVVILALHRRFDLHPELSRKFVHVAIGVVAALLPWIFRDLWPVGLLCAITFVGLLSVKWVPALRATAGPVLHAVKRHSYGDLCFPVAVFLLFAMARHQPIFYLVPMLLLALADAAAALVGVRYGLTRLETGRTPKSLEGSFAFFVVAFFCAHVPLLLGTSIGRLESLLLAATLALLTMMIESIAWSGLDNLLIPLLAHAILVSASGSDAAALGFRLGVTVLMVIGVLGWRWRTPLDDAALALAALYGYAVTMLGGWLWLLSPASVFLVYVLAWRSDERGRYHTVFSVLSVVSTGAIWLFVAANLGATLLVAPAAVAYGAHLAMLVISTLRSERSLRRAGLYGIVGWMAGCVPTLIALTLRFPERFSWSDAAIVGTLGLGAIVIVALGFSPLYHRVLVQREDRQATYLTTAIFAAVASVIAARGLS